MSDPTTSPDPPSPTEPGRLRFDEKAVATLREEILALIGSTPELRGVAAVFDYEGTLNTAGTSFAVWAGEDGEVTKPDAVFGSLHQTLRLAEHMLRKVADGTQTFREKVTVLLTEIGRLTQEKLNLEAQVADLKRQRDDLEAAIGQIHWDNREGLPGG